MTASASASASAPASGGANFFGSMSGPLMVIGAFSSAYGAYNDTKALENQLEFQEAMSGINARLSELSAKQAIIRGERQVQAVRMNATKLKSKQKAAYLANGIALDSATVQDVLNSTDYMAEVDALTAESNALSEAWGYRTQGVNYRAQGAMAGANASGANAGVAAFTSLLTSASYAAPQYYQQKRAGVE